MASKIIATQFAIQVIERLKEKNGALMFHQSGGCCDGSSPMCFKEHEFMTGDSDVLLGEIDDCKFYMDKDQYEYWQHTQLILDVVPGRGSSFSVEIPMGIRFITRARVFTDEELAELGIDNTTN